MKRNGAACAAPCASPPSQPSPVQGEGEHRYAVFSAASTLSGVNGTERMRTPTAS
jgi:hypothetical protein